VSRILLIACCLLASPVLAGQARVEGIRIWAAPDNTRLVFDVSEPIEHSLLTLKNPDRLVIDIESAKLIPDPAQPEKSDGLLRRVRAAARNGDDLRVVLDLGGKVRPTNSTATAWLSTYTTPGCLRPVRSRRKSGFSATCRGTWSSPSTPATAARTRVPSARAVPARR
jgi:hypothetical protein